MKVTRKNVLILSSVIVFLLMIICSPLMAAQKKQSKKPTNKITQTDPLGIPKAEWDASKLSDMSDFDPATWISPTGDTIKIAYVGPFSGPAAINGHFHMTPIMFAIHDINKRGGIWVDGKKKLVELIMADHMSKPDQAKKVVDRMVLQENVKFLMGTAGSNLMKIMNEAANKYNIISVCEGAMSDELQDATNFGINSFMASASTEQVGLALAYYYGQIRKKEKKFYIICQDYSAGHGFADGFKKGLKEYYPEAQIVGEDYHKLFLTDFAPYLSKVKASGAEVIYTGNWSPDSGNLLKQARQMGVVIPFANIFMNEPNELHDQGVELTSGLVNLDQHDVFPAFQNPGYIKLHKAWNDQWKKWKTPPFNSRLFEHGNSQVGAYMMDAYWLLSVIERAKSTDAAKIIKVWEGDVYRFANGKIIKMRACDHKSIQGFTALEYLPWVQQKESYNIPPYYWFKGCSYAAKGSWIPSDKAIPWMDPALERCKGKSSDK